MTSHCVVLIVTAARALLTAAFPVLVWAQGTDISALDDALDVQQLIVEKRQQGDAAAAWNLEQGLLRVAILHPNDARSGRIFRDAGESRMEILSRYESGQVPPELALGCYYKETGQFGETLRFSVPGVADPTTGIGGNNSCESGNRRTARLALAVEALWFYRESARVLLRSENVAQDEVRTALMSVVGVSYWLSIYEIGRWSLLSLLALQQENSGSWVAQAETLAFLGDWDLLFASSLGARYRDSAEITYKQAIALLAENGVAPNAVDELFFPKTPIPLPQFDASGSISRQSPDSLGHVDIAFEIRKNGKTARIKVLDSSVGVPRSAERDLIDLIKRRPFRPIAVDGQLLESAPVTVRYYINN